MTEFKRFIKNDKSIDGEHIDDRERLVKMLRDNPDAHIKK